MTDVQVRDLIEWVGTRPFFPNEYAFMSVETIDGDMCMVIPCNMWVEPQPGGIKRSVHIMSCDVIARWDNTQRKYLRYEKVVGM